MTMASTNKGLLSQISLPTYILVMLFAIASWIDINGLWVEFPLLVNALPEGWGLPSYISLISQVANIGPILYVIANRCAGNARTQVPVIYTIIAVGAVSCLLLAFLWQTTSHVNGAHHSTVLLTLTAFLSLVDCTSSVAFLPYMALLAPQYMTAYYIGEGLSGLLPGLVSLIQGVGAEPTCLNLTVTSHNLTTGQNSTAYVVYPQYLPPLFPVRDFMIFLFVMLCVSGVSFTLLRYTSLGKAQMVQSKIRYEINSAYPQDTSRDHTPAVACIGITTGTGDRYDVTNSAEKLENAVDDNVYSTTQRDIGKGAPAAKGSDVMDRDGPRRLTSAQTAYLLVLAGWVNCLANTVLPSITSFSSLPYGDLAYTLGVRLSAVANPVACMLALFLPTRSLAVVGVHAVLGTMMMGHQLYLAAMSPLPPLKGTEAGTALVILTQVLAMGFLSYEKVSTAVIINESGGGRGLLWVGAVTQVGSFVGAVVCFVVINVYNLLQSDYACSSY